MTKVNNVYYKMYFLYNTASCTTSLCFPYFSCVPSSTFYCMAEGKEIWNEILKLDCASETKNNQNVMQSVQVMMQIWIFMGI
jgi:hypothetical protein